MAGSSDAGKPTCSALAGLEGAPSVGVGAPGHVAEPTVEGEQGSPADVTRRAAGVPEPLRCRRYQRRTNPQPTDIRQRPHAAYRRDAGTEHRLQALLFAGIAHDQRRDQTPLATSDEDIPGCGRRELLPPRRIPLLMCVRDKPVALVGAG